MQNRQQPTPVVVVQKPAEYVDSLNKDGKYILIINVIYS